MHAAVQDRSKQDIETKIETIVQTRHLSDIYTDLKDAVHAQLEKEQARGQDSKETGEAEKKFDEALKSFGPQKKKRRTSIGEKRHATAVQAHLVAEAGHSCGGHPFYGQLGFGCGVGGLLYSLGGSPDPRGLLGGVGLLVDYCIVELGAVRRLVQSSVLLQMRECTNYQVWP